MNKQELNRRLAEWAGLEWDRYKGEYQYPFTTSLDACFKGLERPLVDHFIKTTSTEEEYRLAYYGFLDEWLQDYIWNEPHNPALALCLAIEKLIAKEINNVPTTQE